MLALLHSFLKLEFLMIVVKKEYFFDRLPNLFDF
jgi:hypothetical protein